MPQMEPDEARYSLISSAMNQSGNYVTPHIKNVIYLEKPPLVCWVTAIFFKVFGENDFSARLFAALCTWGCILLAYFIGRHFRDQETGLYAAMLLTISLYPFIIGPKELEKICKGGPEVLFVGAGRASEVKLTEDARRFLAQRSIKCEIAPAVKAVESYSRSKLRKAALIHVTC